MVSDWVYQMASDQALQVASGLSCSKVLAGLRRWSHVLCIGWFLVGLSKWFLVRLASSRRWSSSQEHMLSESFRFH